VADLSGRPTLTDGPADPARPPAETALGGAVPGLLRRTAWAIASVGVSQIVLVGIGLVGNLLLSRVLTPRDFGIYAIAALVLDRVGPLADLGLHNRLVHDRDPPTPRHYRSVFTLQLGLAVVAFAAIYLLAVPVARVFRLEEDSVDLIRFMGSITLLVPIEIIPRVQLTRRLAYGRLSVVDLSLALGFQATAITLAYRGFGYWSFGFAAMAGVIVRALVLNLLSRWPLGLAWDATYLKSSLRFGGAFQLSTLTSVPREMVPSVLGGLLFGPTAVGLLNWAYRLAVSCSDTLVAVVSRVAFPALSRLRDAPDVFAKVLRRMLQYANLFALGALSVVGALLPEIVEVAFTTRWMPAVPLFYWYAVRLAGTSYTSVLDFALRAQGHPKRSLLVLGTWTLMDWLAAVACALLFGYVGIAASAALWVWVTNAWLYREVARRTPLRLDRTSLTPWLSAAATFGALHLAKGAWVRSWTGLLGGLALGAALYAAACLSLSGRRFWAELKNDVKLLRREAPATAS
jgi:PST family polysaccharide transporter